MVSTMSDGWRFEQVGRVHGCRVGAAGAPGCQRGALSSYSQPCVPRLSPTWGSSKSTRLGKGAQGTEWPRGGREALPQPP